ncbi:Pre-mRNA-splicing factor 18, partial [Phytophthora megakarya]
MEALMRVMAAKKREVSAVQEKKGSKKEKYLRRAEVESLLEEEEAPTKKRKLDQTTPESSKTIENDTEQTETPQKESEALLAWPDLRRRLRELGEPITLFGESMQDRMTRLRRVEMDAVTKHEDELGAGHDIRNRFDFVGGEDAQREQNEAEDEEFATEESEKNKNKEKEDDQDQDKM